jgi:hypothetical protein
MALVQTFTYYERYPQDWIIYRVFVCVDVLVFNQYIDWPFLIGWTALVRRQYRLGDEIVPEIIFRLLDAAHLGVTVQMGYHYLVESYGNLSTLLEIST